MAQSTVKQENVLRAVSGVLGTIEHATIATVSAQGRPWNTPVYFARHGATLYWISRVDAQHSSNLRNNPHAFAVIYDSGREDSTGAALYIDAHVTELTDKAAIEFAATLIYRRRGKPVPSLDRFHEPSPHRIYLARALRTWTNVLHLSDPIPWDERIEIDLNGA
jgi:hypothetical protein